MASANSNCLRAIVNGRATPPIPLSTTQASRSPVADIFMNLEVTLTGAPAGEYQVRFVVTDANSKKTVTVIHPITVK